MPDQCFPTAAQQADWRARHALPADLDALRPTVLAYAAALAEALDKHGPGPLPPERYNHTVRRLARAGHPILPKATVRRAYLVLVEEGAADADERVLRALRLKPTRTVSGVAPVTVLTKPYPCPGQCIYCPDDVRMPRSYLPDEPGAMRALRLRFDPYTQTRERITALHRIGHPVDKVDLLVLGGTFSAYTRAYQAWFVRRTFDALNTLLDADADHRVVEPPVGASAAGELEKLTAAQQRNESAPHRGVGLCIETRPDRVSADEVTWLRRLGVTRVQLGVQSTDDRVLAANRRGHTLADARRAVGLLRAAGFKVTLHLMQNLLDATAATDLADFARLWDDLALRPDEVKLYPTALLEGTPLYDEHYLAGDYVPYTEDELIELLAACKRLVPRYARINRVMRDIPAPYVADGVVTSNLRQLVQDRLRVEGTPCQCVRCREVRREAVDAAALRLDALPYDTNHSREVFLSAVTPSDRIAGFLRLSLPTHPAPIPELAGQAVIRQVQVYGPSVALDDSANGRAQHQGIGRRLIEAACTQARNAGFARLAVIAAVGTRDYYRGLGFEEGELYLSRAL